MPADSSADFATRLLAWHRHHGRHDLPWQIDRNPYRVWLSEIMLQQTQVATVIPYFLRFTERFADVADLAAGELDEVLSLWSGLGYYARARNLHRCAQHIVQHHQGRFPAHAETLQSLPGIGKSTAHAILAQALNQPHAILDGNVKRVLSRHGGVSGWPGATAVQKQLWALAERRTPDHSAADYTQAIMDLGATCCRRSKPACARCPVADDCVALHSDRVESLPERKPRKAKPQRVQYLQLVECDGELWLQRRPPSGIWGGLWCPPLQEDEPDSLHPRLPSIQHSFSHFDLELRPYRVENQATIQDFDGAWFRITEALELGLPAPIRRLLNSLTLEDA